MASSPRDHAEVAVAGLARMHEERRRAGRGEGGRQLLADVPALADAGDDHAALGGGKRRHRPAESGAQLLVQRRPAALCRPSHSRSSVRAAELSAAARGGAPGDTTRSLRLGADAGIRAALMGAGGALSAVSGESLNRATFTKSARRAYRRAAISAQIPGNHNHPFGMPCLTRRSFCATAPAIAHGSVTLMCLSSTKLPK